MAHCLIKKLKLFWQYPVITEQMFYNQEKGNSNYVGFPWATIIDKQYSFNTILMLLKKNVVWDNTREYYTCCQHIFFRKLIPMWRELGIKIVYTPHKIIGQDKINGIKLRPCPLYAVNIEDSSRNGPIIGSDLLKIDRKFLYSFAGAYQSHNYLTDIRARIYKLQTKSCDDVYIKNTGDWHFNHVVYSCKQNPKGELNEDDVHKKNTLEYTDLLLQSRYTLAPSGSGPNSIRFWEALGAGSIPVLLADTLELPHHELWDTAIIRIKEKQLSELDGILREISPEEEEDRREKCLKLYKHFKNNYTNNNTHK